MRPARPVLAAEQSAALRDRLLAELNGLPSADEAANWVHLRLPDKNLLRTSDAQLVEDRFKAKLETLADEQPQETPSETVHDSQAAEPCTEGENGIRRTIDRHAARSSDCRTPWLTVRRRSGQLGPSASARQESAD